MKWRALFIVTLAVLSTATFPDPAELEPLVGDYVLDGRTTATAQRDASINTVVRQMNAVVRPVARRRLRDGNPIPARLSIRRTGSKLTVGFDRSESTAVVGGDAVPTLSNRGDPLEMTLRQRGAVLTQRFVGKIGGKENVFRRVGNDLVVDVRVFSERLPADVVYQLKFKR